MSMPTTPFRRPEAQARRPWRSAAAWCGLSALLVLALSACGPGVGGTGTGQEHGVSEFGAVAAPLCTSDLAEQLSCPPPVDGARPQVGSLPLLLADGTPPLLASGRVDGSQIELTLRCEGWSFFGEWGVATGAPDGRFYGTGRGPGGRLQPAVLLLAALPGGGFQATLQDSSGAALAVPVALQVVGSLDGAQACSN